LNTEPDNQGTSSYKLADSIRITQSHYIIAEITMSEDYADDVEGEFIDESEQPEDDISVLSNGSGMEDILLAESTSHGRGGGRKSHSRGHQAISSPGVRKGKWTAEEENYTQKIISLFNRGKLPIPAGTTLRSYLSEKLNW
jgi:hypothetical protein